VVYYRWNSHYHFFPESFSCFEEALKKLPELFDQYNTRPTKPLNGLTPNEAFEQCLYGKAMFSKDIKEAMTLRTQENKSKSCGVC